MNQLIHVPYCSSHVYIVVISCMLLSLHAIAIVYYNYSGRSFTIVIYTAHACAIMNVITCCNEPDISSHTIVIIECLLTL